jgi:glycosyltransferase involved in cell wall biosynthesis
VDDRAEPIRVMRVIARLNVGGPALHVSYLTGGLDRMGYETTLVAGSVSEGEGSMEYAARAVGVEPFYLPGLQREISPLVDIAAVARLVRLIQRIRPHVLHTHTAKAGAVGRAAAMLAGPARPAVVVHTFHGHVLRGYFGAARSEAFRRLERTLARHSDALIAVSPEVRDDLVRLGVAPASKIVVIRLGLDLAGRVSAPPGARDALRAELGVPGDRFLVGWLGRMTEIKRVDVLMRALARIGDEGVEVLLVGDGPLRSEMEILAGEIGVRDRVHFAGFRTDVASVYAAVDAVALTSANEGTPVTVIEALAAGRPVVSTDVGGVRDVVTEGRSGYLVPQGDADGLVDRLRRLAADPELRNAMGEAGRAIVVPRYSVPRLVSDVDRLYRELLEQADPRSYSVVGRRPRPLPPTLPRRGVLRTARPLRIVLVSQYFSPEVGATQSRIQTFAEHLASRGHRVTVIAEFPNHPQGVMPDEYRGRVIEDDRSNPYRVLRVWVKTSVEKTQLTRLSFYLSFMALATAVSPLAGRTDVVVATTPPLFAGAAGWAIARMKGAPLVLDVRDLWPAAATSLDQISPGLPTRLAEVIERQLYCRADAVMAVTRPFCEHIDRIRRRPPRTVPIPNGTLELFFAEPEQRNRLGVPEGQFLVVFAGMHGIAQALPVVLDAAARSDGRVHFAFVGEGPTKEIVVSAARERGLENVSFHPQAPLEEIVPMLAGSDALLVPLSAHPTFEGFVPSKLIDYLAVGRPVLLSAAGEAVRLLERSGGGIAVPPEDSARLAEAIRWLAEHPSEAAEMGRRGRAFARKRLRSAQAERLEELLLDVAPRR